MCTLNLSLNFNYEYKNSYVDNDNAVKFEFLTG